MKKTLLFLAALFTGAIASAQTWDHSSPMDERSGPLNGSLAIPSGYFVIKDDGAAMPEEGILNFISGTNITVTCVDNPGSNQTDCTFDASGGGGGAPTDADYLVGTANGSLSAEIVVGTTPGGELGGTWASPTLDDNVTVSGWTCTTCTALATDTLWDAAGDLTIGSGANTAAKLAVGVEGQSLSVNSSGAVAWLGAGVSPSAGACVATRNTACFFEDFYARAVNLNGAPNTVVGNMTVFASTGSGAASLGTAATPLGLYSDGNHPGILGLSTGTSLTGWAAVNGAMAGSTTANTPTILINGGEIYESLTAWPYLSGVGNANTNDKFKLWWGFGDAAAATGDPTNGLYVYLDTTVDTHFGCGAASASGGAATNSISTLVGNAATWYTIRIVVNSAATSVAYFVNGTELSCSPLTGADLPVAAGEITHVQNRIGTHDTGADGCNNAQDCILFNDYVYYFDPTITR